MATRCKITLIFFISSCSCIFNTLAPIWVYLQNVCFSPNPINVLKFSVNPNWAGLLPLFKAVTSVLKLFLTFSGIVYLGGKNECPQQLNEVSDDIQVLQLEIQV